MASYVSIKGWIECSDDDIKIIQENINNFWNNCPFNIEEKESAKIYKSGWVFPTNSFNWSDYIFFGACVKSYFIIYFEKCIKTIMELDIEISGFFELDYYEDNYKVNWKINNGNLIQTTN